MLLESFQMDWNVFVPSAFHHLLSYQTRSTKYVLLNKITKVTFNYEDITVVQ